MNRHDMILIVFFLFFFFFLSPPRYPRAMSEAKRAGAKGMNIYQIFNGSGAPGVWDTGLVEPGNVRRESSLDLIMFEKV